MEFLEMEKALGYPEKPHALDNGARQKAAMPWQRVTGEYTLDQTF
jgi:hypothetical protein